MELLNNYVFSVKSDFQEKPTFDYSSCIESRDHDLEHVVGVVEKSEIPENTDFSTEPHQQALSGLSETPTPVPAPPSQPKPKRARAEVPAEAKALYPALFELTRLPRKGRAAMGVYTKARDLWQEFSATPEQIAGFWEWFKTFSRPAQMAARDQRPLNPPLPAQVYELWPQFLPWWEAKQAAVAREAARVAREEAERQARQPAAETEERRPGSARELVDLAPTLAWLLGIIPPAIVPSAIIARTSSG
jgi:hypothetical protein